MSSILMKRKIDLFNKLYKEIAGHGINGDTELAHVNKYEAAVLKAMGGSGTVNKTTGLKQYDMFGSDDPAPAPAPSGTTTVKQVSDLPEYFKPYVEELFAVSQDVYDRPYVPFGSKAVKDDEGNWSVEKLPDIINPETGEAVSADKRLADVTAEQKAAFAGLRDMFTQVDPETGVRSFRDPSSEGFKEATRLSERGAKGFDELEEGEFQETYMSPYKQAVTDIQIREAEKKQEAMRRKRQGAARMANALGQGRFGAEQAMASFYDQQLLDDIQKKGLQESWTEGLKVFDSDRSAARAGATQRAGMTTDELTSGLKSLGALQSTGETQRAIAQQPLDMSYEEFARQQQFPKQNLQELSGILRGFQVQPTTYQTSQQYKPPQSLGQQLLAAGTLGAGISKGLGKSLLGAKDGGIINAAKGGTINPNPQAVREGGGLAGMGLMADLLQQVIAQRQAEGLPIPFMKNKNPNEQIDMEEQVGIFAEAAGGGLMSLANGGVFDDGDIEYTEDVNVQVDETYIPRDVSQIPGLKGVAARTLQRSKGYDAKGNPLETADQALKKRREAIEGKYPSAEEQEENWRRTLRQMPPKSDTTSMPQIILRNQAENMVKDIETSKVKKDDEIKIPEGAADELTQQEFLEQITTTSTPSDSDSGWDIRKILEGFGEGFEAAAPYLASYAKQKGWDDSSEGLKGISDAALKKAQVDYYKGLGLKARAYEAIERLKANRTLSQKAVENSLKAIKPRMDFLIKKMETLGINEEEEVELQKLINKLTRIEAGYGAFPASTGSDPLKRIRKE